MGCSSSKTQEQCSQAKVLAADLSIPLQQHPRLGEDMYIVSLKSSTYGIMKGEHTKQTRELRSSSMSRIETKHKESLIPVYEEFKNFDTCGGIVSDVNAVLSKLKLEEHFFSAKESLKFPEIINTWELMAGLEGEESSSTGTRPRGRPRRRSRSVDGSQLSKAGSCHESMREEPSRELDGGDPLHAVDCAVVLQERRRCCSMSTETGSSSDATSSLSAENSSATFPSEWWGESEVSSDAAKEVKMEVSGDAWGGEEAKQQGGKQGKRGQWWEEEGLEELAAELERALEEIGGGGGAREEEDGEGGEVVLYTTSLRGVRSTFEDCQRVKTLLDGYAVEVDERDVAMDAGLLREAQALQTSPQRRRRLPAVPRLLVRGRDLGGAADVLLLNDQGRLSPLLRGLPRRPAADCCSACGGARFLPCPACCGSRKLFAHCSSASRCCPHCNENGLSRCPLCCRSSSSSSSSSSNANA